MRRDEVADERQHLERSVPPKDPPLRYAARHQQLPENTEGSRRIAEQSNKVEQGRRDG